MKKTILFNILLISCSFNAFSQWHDMNWLLGYEKEETMLVSFNNNAPLISSFPCNLNFAWTNNVMSDSEGSLQFYTNGIALYNKNNELIYNGDSLNFNNFTIGYMEGGYSTRNAIISLPDPGDPHRYYIFHRRVDTSAVYGIKVPDLLYTLVDMQMNNGSGEVLFKNEPILQSFAFDGSSAVKHANGRDWWVLTSEVNNNNYTRFLLTPYGLQDTGIQTIGEKPPYNPPESGDDYGQNLFSPDGTIYVEHDVKSGTRIFDFDRCTGMLSNFRWIQYTEDTQFGAAISPNSRYLYVISTIKVYQFDLWADDIAASRKKVADYDGFNPVPPPLLFPFIAMQLAPDGKIYIQGAQFHLHTIHHPNLPGLACDVRQHDIITPQVIGVTWPHYPNYRLGPIDGSGCDTLGINNIPLAHYTWEADTIAPQWIRFTDNSFYEPTDWVWDFGDGTNSTEVNPDHSYANTGIYDVCLTVSNTYGNNTFCREVEIITVGTDEISTGGKGLRIFPNPANSSATLTYHLNDRPSDVELNITDTYGKLIRKQTVNPNLNNFTFDLTDFPAGVYVITLHNKDEIFGFTKFVVIK